MCVLFLDMSTGKYNATCYTSANKIATTRHSNLLLMPETDRFWSLSARHSRSSVYSPSQGPCGGEILPLWPKCSSPRKPARSTSGNDSPFRSSCDALGSAPCESHSVCSWRASQLKGTLVTKEQWTPNAAGDAQLLRWRRCRKLTGPQTACQRSGQLDGQA